MFNSTGIPCRHIIAYLCKFNDGGTLPGNYILKRWTKSAKSGTVVDDNGMDIVDDNSYLLKRSQFVQSSLDLVDKALFDKGFKFITNKYITLSGLLSNR